MSRPPRVGAVIYDPKVSVIWELIQAYFAAGGVPMDTVFYTNYALQVTALLEGHIDIAWNSPLAWLDAQRRSGGRCRAIAMRDTDRDRVSHLVVRREGGLARIEDLAGRTVATGASDSPQATLIPLGLLARHGLREGRDLTLRRFEVLVGKHGDHIGGEREALGAVLAGEADACAVLDLNWQAWQADGTAPATQLRVLASTAPFDHCVFTVGPDFPAEREGPWLARLLAMDYADAAQREIMDLEGLRAWQPGRTSGFGPLSEAVAALGYFDA